MYPVSARFLPRLAEDHRPVTQVQLFLTDGRVLDLEHTGGSVTVDRSQAIRRTCTVTVADPALIPRTPADQLATYGARLRISRGVEYGNPGDVELVPLGVFRSVDRAVHHELEVAQHDSVLQSRGEGDIEKLLNAGDTWTIV